jgi:hypothetical protein
MLCYSRLNTKTAVKRYLNSSWFASVSPAKNAIAVFQIFYTHGSYKSLSSAEALKNMKFEGIEIALEGIWYEDNR